MMSRDHVILADQLPSQTRRNAYAEGHPLHGANHMMKMSVIIDPGPEMTLSIIQATIIYNPSTATWISQAAFVE
jgi:hypothetical protein